MKNLIYTSELDVIVKIIAVSWGSCIIVGWYIDLCLKAKVRIRKPWGCELCMGFWIGLIIFGFMGGLLNGIIFALITSLTAAIMGRYVKR